MFSPPRFTHNSFSVVFPRQLTIRRMANSFEDRLKGHYFQPQIIPIPDDFDPEVPRIIFGSEHGYSQIVISQVSFSLNVSYSSEWQHNIDKGREYLLDRTPLLFDLLKIAKIVKPYFCGLVTQVHISSTFNDRLIISHLAKTFLKDEHVEDLHDIEIKKTKVILNKYFNNTTISNYRIWSIEAPSSDIFTLSKNETIDRGIRILCDHNDRYSFNESKSYQTKRSLANTIIHKGLESTSEVISQIGVLS